MLYIPLVVVLALPTIWIVDQANGPGTNFTDLPPAIAAAQSGDTILVRAGNYTNFVVSGKALTIRGAANYTTFIRLPHPNSLAPTTTIDSVPAGQSFFVEGVTFSLPNLSVPPPLQVGALNLTGAGSRVVLSYVGAGMPTFPGVGGRGLVIGPGVEVHASRCTFTGGQAESSLIGGPLVGALGGTAIVLGTNATLAASLTTILGGNALGTNGTAASPNTGGTGLQVEGGTVSLSRCPILGGTGSSSTTLGASKGGTGLKVAQTSLIRIAGTLGEPIAGGGAGLPANEGLAINNASATPVIVHHPIWVVSGVPGGPTLGLVTMSTVSLPNVFATGTSMPSGEFDANQPVTLTVNGWLGQAPAILAFDFQPAFPVALSPQVLGEVLVPLPPAGYLQGSTNSFGTWTVTGVPIAIPALTNVPIYVQAAVFDGVAGQFRVSGSEVLFFKN
jgi:hypothetical protein